MKKNAAILLRIIIGIVFIISAYSKLIAPGIVEIILIDHGLAASREAAAIYVRILIGLEFAFGILFFQPYLLKKAVLPAALLFLVGFSIYLVYTGFIIGDTQNCGCFGTMIEMSPFESLVKNIVLILAVAAVYKTAGADKTNYYFPAILILLPITFVFILSPLRKTDNYKFAVFTNFEGKGRTDLTDGELLVAVYNTECDHCQELAKEITSLKKSSKKFPAFYVLIFSEGEISVDSFKTITGFDFPYHKIDSKTFFDLIGQSPPRIYSLENGKVKEYWDKDFINKIENNFVEK